MIPVPRTPKPSVLARYKELITERSHHVKTLMALLPYAQKGDPEAIDILKEACQPDAKYSAFTRILILPYLP